MFSNNRKIVLDRILTGRIVEWDDRRGYGFLQLGAARVFLHRRDFVEFHKPPTIGDRIEFSVGVDGKGRTCARGATHRNDGGKLGMKDLFALAGLLALPMLAVARINMGFRWWAAYALGISAITYLAYARDKQSAKAKTWRIPENTLHLLELLGGWPGGFLAQRRLRHKCSKTRFQAVFWTIVLIFQLTAIDAMMDWALAKRIFHSLRDQATRKAP
jgi:uncharacterized membrane protein YsdA (DUF1294 family)